MEGLFCMWRTSRYHAIWVLQRVQPHRLPRDLVRHVVEHYMAWEHAYCWLCLSAFPVHIWRGSRVVMRYEHHDGRPVCGPQCNGIVPRPIWLPSYQGEDVAAFMRARDFLIVHGFCELNIETHQQRRVMWQVQYAKREKNDKARAAILKEAHQIAQQHKCDQREARLAASRRGKRWGK